MAGLVFPPDVKGRVLAVARIYSDESYDGKLRVYAMAAYIGWDRHWDKLAKLWKQRCKKYGVPYFHAADCESGLSEDYRHLSKEQRTELKTDLVRLTADWQRYIQGFSFGLYVGDYDDVRASSEKAKQILHEKHYFFCFEQIIAEICRTIGQFQAKGFAPAFIFDQQQEFAGRALAMFQQLKARPDFGEHMGTVAFEDKKKFVPLQMVDNLAYETMKDFVNKRFDPGRPERIAMTKLKTNLVWIKYASKASLENVVQNAA